MTTQAPFEPTNSWCYHFARYQALPEILAMPEVAAVEQFRLLEYVKLVMNQHLTQEQQAMKYPRKETGKPLSIAASVKWYVPFVARNTEQLVALGDGMFRVPSVDEVGAAADEAEEEEASESDEVADSSDIFDGWIYAFTFPTLVKDVERFPIKVGMTASDVELRVTSQCRSSAAFDAPIVLGKWAVRRVGWTEKAIHLILKSRGQWREQALGTEWFDATPTEIAAIVTFVTQG